MRNPFKRTKNVYRGVSVSGPKIRPATGSCPGCGVKQNDWCQPWCKTIDESWYKQGRPDTRGN
jgi:hypothetical protein